MHILQVSPKTFDVRARKAAHWCRKQGYRVTMITGRIWHATPKSLIWDRQIDGLDHAMFNLTAQPGLRSSLESFKPDLVHFHEVGSMWPAAANWEALGVKEGVLRGSRANEIPIYAKPFPWPTIYEAHEYEADRPKRWDQEVHREICYQENQVGPIADHVITVSPSIRKALSVRWGLPFNRTSMISNLCPLPPRPLKREEMRERHGYKPDDIVIAFCGAIGADRGIRELAIAISQLPERFRLMHLGLPEGGDEGARGMCQILGGMVSFGEHVYPFTPLLEADPDRTTMLDMLSMADVGYNSAKSEFATWRWALPNKLFEYMAARVPVAQSRGMTDAAALIEGCRAGLLFDPKNASDLAQTLKTIGENRERFLPGCDRFNKAYSYDAVYDTAMARAYDRAIENFQRRGDDD